jgi:hypothetical protein
MDDGNEDGGGAHRYNEGDRDGDRRSSEEEGGQPTANDTAQNAEDRIWDQAISLANHESAPHDRRKSAENQKGNEVHFILQTEPRSYYRTPTITLLPLAQGALSYKKEHFSPPARRKFGPASVTIPSISEPIFSFPATPDKTRRLSRLKATS